MTFSLKVGTYTLWTDKPRITWRVLSNMVYELSGLYTALRAVAKYSYLDEAGAQRIERDGEVICRILGLPPLPRPRRMGWAA